MNNLPSFLSASSGRMRSGQADVPGFRPQSKMMREVKISRPTRPALGSWMRYCCIIVCFENLIRPLCRPGTCPGGRFQAHTGGRADRAGIFEFLLVIFPTSKGWMSAFSTLGILRSRINWVCGPEQEVSLNKKKKAVNHSCYPDEVIERLARCFYPAILESFNNEEDQKAFAAWQAEQARCSAKEKQDVPDGERPAIHTQLFSSRVRPLGRTFFNYKTTSYTCG